MPQPLFLHIRARSRGAIRVVEVQKDFVRIGRGADCDARLEDDSIAEVECFLRRHGETWHVQPLSDRGRLTVDGRPVKHLRAIPLGVALRVGNSVLVLRESAATTTEFRPVEFSGPIDPVAETRPHPSVDEDDRRLSDHPYDDPLKNFARSRNVAAPPSRDSSPQPRRRVSTAEQLWEAKWRAVGRSIQNHEPRTPPPVSPQKRPQASVSPEPAIVRFVPRPELETRSEAASFGAESGAVRVEDPQVPDLLEATDSDSFDPPSSEVSPGVEVPHEPSTDSPPEIPDLSTTVAEIKVHWDISPDIVVTTALDASPFDPHEHVAAPVVDGRSVKTPISHTPVPDSPESPPLRDEVLPRPRSETWISPATDHDEHEWPSVSAILSAHASRPEPVRPRPRPQKRRPTPTSASEPAHWSPPGVLVGLISSAAIVLVGALGIFLAFQWGRDDAEAGALADRLLRPNLKATDLVSQNDVNPEGTWWKTTSGHLAIRAAALGTSQGDGSKDESAKFLLETARNVAPLEPASRLARADLDIRTRRGEVPISSLGLSRDTLSLSLSARILAQAGRTPSALAAYKKALEVAVKSEMGRGSMPVLAEQGDSKRFTLPSERLVLTVIRDMAGQADWTFQTWSESLPDHGIVWLATYRVLKERNAEESETALTRLAELPETPSAGSIAIHTAAKAEGLAIKGRWQEAEALYTEAIRKMPEVSIGRTWHLNRAVILARGGEIDEAKEAEISARAGRGDDEIGRRVADALLEFEGLGRKANTSPVNRIQRKTN